MDPSRPFRDRAPLRVVRPDRPSHLAGRGNSHVESLSPEFQASHEARIAAKVREIAAEMKRRGLRYGEALRVCLVCGKETADAPTRLRAAGWVEPCTGEWVCPECVKKQPL